MVDDELMSTVDIILMSMQDFMPTGDAGGKMSALCLLFIYFCLNIRALVEVKHGLRI